MAKKDIDPKDVLLNTKKNVFLTGPAGSGKTTLIKELLDMTPNAVVCAPTGVAAVNAGGETMHRLFKIPVPAYGHSTASVKPADISVLKAADLVIIDEISMARADAFSFAIKVLKKAEKLKGSKIRLVVVGDFAQLPPVVTKTEEKMLVKFGYHPSGLPFTTKEWASCSFTTIELTKIHRQDNPEFLGALSKARVADPACLDYFNDFVVTPDRPIPEDVVRICGTNAEADEINTAYIDSLPGMLFAYKAKKKGRVSSYAVFDEVVFLKEGARVIFTYNDPKRRFINGTIGRVAKLDADKVLVNKEDGKSVWVEAVEHPVYNYTAPGGVLKKTEVGSFSQIPLKVCAAMTIHKSQGKTFDAEVLTPSIFAPGQLYVALSRVRGPEGLFLTQEISEAALIPDPVVADFVNSGYVWTHEQPSTPVKKKTSAAKTTKTSKPTKTRSTKTSKTTKAKKTTKTKASSTKLKTTPKKTTKKNNTKKTTTRSTTKSTAKTKPRKTTTRKTTKPRTNKPSTRKVVKK